MKKSTSKVTIADEAIADKNSDNLPKSVKRLSVELDPVSGKQTTVLVDDKYLCGVESVSINSGCLGKQTVTIVVGLGFVNVKLTPTTF